MWYHLKNMLAGLVRGVPRCFGLGEGGFSECKRRTATCAALASARMMDGMKFVSLMQGRQAGTRDVLSGAGKEDGLAVWFSLGSCDVGLGWGWGWGLLISDKISGLGGWRNGMDRQR